MLTLRSITARPVVLKLKRPVVARIAAITEWPLVLIDLQTEEGIVGRAYLEPYVVNSLRYLVPALDDFGVLLKGRPVAPVELFEAARKSLHFVGYEGLSMIAASGLDMAAWDALAQAAGQPLCALLGGSVGPVKAYNSNGLWLQEPEAVAAEALELRDEGGFAGLKLRLGRESVAADLATLDAVRRAVGNDMHLMVDFNQGLTLAEALQRCHLIDGHGLAWIEEPIVYDNRRLRPACAGTADSPADRRELLWAARDAQGPATKGLRSRDARLHAHRRRHRLAARRGHCRRGRRSDVHASLSGGRGACDAGDGDRALAGMAGLGGSDPGRALRGQGRQPRHSRPSRRWLALE